jgi:predicted CoA-binding protein
MTIVVLGASENPNRYSYLASARLQQYKFQVVNVSLHAGLCAGLPIQTDFSVIKAVDTITIYVSPAHQAYWEKFIYSLNPKRLIFNPGAENPELAQQAMQKGIEVVEGCTLVMLSAGTF